MTLFEATEVIGNGKLARMDILRKRGNEFHLIEVKVTSFHGDENAAAVAEGRPNLFRTKRNHSIDADWRDYLAGLYKLNQRKRSAGPDFIGVL